MSEDPAAKPAPEPEPLSIEKASAGLELGTIALKNSRGTTL
jgi:hypothetical protein